MLKKTSAAEPVWATVQGSGEFVHEHESYTAWRLLAQGSWVSGTQSALDALPWLAADLQEFYRVWLLPFQRHILQKNEAAVSTVHVPAGLLRRIAVERTQDSLLRILVTQFSRRIDDELATGDGDFCGATVQGDKGARSVRTSKLCVDRS